MFSPSQNLMTPSSTSGAAKITPSEYKAAISARFMPVGSSRIDTSEGFMPPNGIVSLNVGENFSVEMSLYKSYSHRQADARKPEAKCDVHVGEMWMPYPCFDSEDFAIENRSYQNFVFREHPINQDDMRVMSELPSKGNECRISENMPAEVLPIVFYVGDGDSMLVAT